MSQLVLPSILSLTASYIFIKASIPPHRPPSTSKITKDHLTLGTMVLDWFPTLSIPIILTPNLLQLYGAYCQWSRGGLVGVGKPDLLSVSSSGVVGNGLMILGGGLRLWCYAELGRFFTFKLAVHDDHKLIQTGPYTHIRHPSYTGLLLMTTGVLLRTFEPNSYFARYIPAYLRGWPVLVVEISCVAWTFIRRIKLEEAMMKGSFGLEWDRYETKTWRLMPYIW